jgi:hypothetical protein
MQSRSVAFTFGCGGDAASGLIRDTTTARIQAFVDVRETA